MAFLHEPTDKVTARLSVDNLSALPEKKKNNILIDLWFQLALIYGGSFAQLFSLVTSVLVLVYGNCEHRMIVYWYSPVDWFLCFGFFLILVPLLWFQQRTFLLFSDFANQTSLAGVVSALFYFLIDSAILFNSINPKSFFGLINCFAQAKTIQLETRQKAAFETIVHTLRCLF